MTTDEILSGQRLAILAMLFRSLLLLPNKPHTEVGGDNTCSVPKNENGAKIKLNRAFPEQLLAEKTEHFNQKNRGKLFFLLTAQQAQQKSPQQKFKGVSGVQLKLLFLS